MKKITVLLLLLTLALTLAACQRTDKVIPHNPPHGDTVGLIGGLLTPQIRVNDIILLTTGRESKTEMHTVDGIITTAVALTQAPTENDQSNFGAGYEYSIINGTHIDVKIDDRWIAFKAW